MCNAQLNEALPFSAGDRRNISRGMGYLRRWLTDLPLLE